ncbi:MAG: hypothetical protein GYB31_16230 [Bacteroidetes bacterium]|nr:hypothetical protein [Bacteroidota bacterium]
MKNAFLFILALCFSSFLPHSAQAQEEKEPWFGLSANGYVKDLQTLILIDNPTGVGPSTFVTQYNFLHHRLNTRWDFGQAVNLKLDFRTRFFWGGATSINKTFIEQLDGSNDYFNLATGAANDQGIGIHSMIDRAYLEYAKGSWEIRLGRQRINWGINTLWNPNDVFNAYAFTDFDYEERPGSDALRVRYFMGYASSAEIAVRMADNWKDAILASRANFNIKQYDFQVIAGYVQEDLVLGGGWAGNIGNAGFKGEFSYFQPLPEDRDPAFAMSVGVDYMTAKSLFLTGGALFNSQGQWEGNLATLFNFELSARNLYPYKLSVFSQAAYPISPLLNAAMVVVYSPSKAHALFLSPTLTYSIASNWDLDLIGQIAFNEDDGYISPVQAMFLRVKFSY